MVLCGELNCDFDRHDDTEDIIADFCDLASLSRTVHLFNSVDRFTFCSNDFVKTSLIDHFLISASYIHCV